MSLNRQFWIEREELCDAAMRTWLKIGTEVSFSSVIHVLVSPEIAKMA